MRDAPVHEERGVCCSENATVAVLFLVERCLTGRGVGSGEEESREIETSSCKQLDREWRGGIPSACV